MPRLQPPVIRHVLWSAAVAGGCALLVIASCRSDRSQIAPIESPAQGASPARSVVEGTARMGGPIFAHERSDLPVDPAIRFGRLANGLRWAVMPNHQPKDKVSIRMRVACGSLQESDAQRGLAHYLEHMAFNGSTRFPPGSLVTTLQARGLAFGAHTNAHTSFDETVYKLDLPDTAAETLDLGLAVLADTAGALLLGDEEIERERGIILAELRDGDRPGLRLYRAAYRALYAGTVVGERFPIGVQETIAGATPQLIRSYYDDWYQPGRIVLVVTGAVDPTVVEAKIGAEFAALAARAVPRAAPGLGEPSPGIAYAVHHEPEADDIQVRITRVRPRARPADNAATRHRQFIADVAERVLSRRLATWVEQNPSGPLLSAGPFSYQWQDFYHAGIGGDAKPGRALEALAVIEQEYRRMREHGPTAAELAVERTDQLAGYDQAVAQAGNRTNAALATEIYSAVGHDQVAMGPQAARDLYRPWIEALTPEACRDGLQTAWLDPDAPLGRLVVSVMGKEALGADAQERLAAAYAASVTVPVAAPAPKAAATWAYAIAHDGPVPPGIVRADRGDLHQATLVNGVRIAVKRTAFQPNQVLVHARLAVAPHARPMPSLELAGRAFLAGGLGRHDAAELREVLAGSSIVLRGPGLEDDGVSFGFGGLPKDLRGGIEQLRAFLTDAGWRSEAEITAKAGWIEELKALDTNLDAQLARRFQALTVNDVPWRRSATLAEAEAATLAEARSWLDPLLRTAPLSISVVGDVDAEAVIADLARAFSTLPARQPVAMAASPADPTVLADAAPMPTGLSRFAIPGTVARAMVRVAWPTTDHYDVARTRRLGLLAQAFSERLRVRVREELGVAYSPFAWRSASETWRGFGYLGAQVGTAPEKIESARQAVLDLAADLAANGIDDALLAQVKTPLIKNLVAQRQQNAYWLGSVLARSAWQPFRIDWAENMEADYGAITAAELGELAKRYLVNDQALQVVVVCAGSGAGKDGAPAVEGGGAAKEADRR